MKCASVLLAVSCLLSAVRAQYWTGPFPLADNPSDDVNPSACKEFLPGDMTCLVWQQHVAEAWNISGRFGHLYNGSGWEVEQWVTLDSFEDNVNPAVACLNDSADHPRFCCVWEHMDWSLGGSIRASFNSSGHNWEPGATLGRSIHTDGDSAQPSIIVINGTAADTVWVVWRNHDTSGTYISYSYNAGDSWSTEQVAVAGDLRHARLGRCNVQYHQRPMLVWENDGDIWYSIRDSSGWRTPAQVAYSSSEDRGPDVVSGGDGGFLDGGSYVVWESMRDGDTAIYVTASDTFSIGCRACNVFGAGRNFNPAGADVGFTGLDYWWCFVAWVSDRNGNPDIYTSHDYPGDEWVDLDPANDLAPVVTCMGSWMGSQMAWVLWQSDRNGNWDIFGSYHYNSGIEESPKPQGTNSRPAATVLRNLPVGAVAFDATGRRVVNPRPGVYFVQEAQAQTQAMRKVILQR